MNLASVGQSAAVSVERKLALGNDVSFFGETPQACAAEGKSRPWIYLPRAPRRPRSLRKQSKLGRYSANLNDSSRRLTALAKITSTFFPPPQRAMRLGEADGGFICTRKHFPRLSRLSRISPSRCSSCASADRPGEAAVPHENF